MMDHLYKDGVPCIVGIDGGGTKTFMRVITEDGRILCEVHGRSSNLCSNSEKQVNENLSELFEKARKASDTPIQFKSICIGTAGVSKENAKTILLQMVQTITNCRAVVVKGDMEIPLEVNAYKENGIILISGTGSICYGKNTGGEEARSGGWGHVFSDEGSAYWIACHILNAVMKAYDGRGTVTSMTEMLLDYYKITTPQNLIQKIYTNPFDKTEIARIAPFAEQASDQGDVVATHIQSIAATCLYDLIVGVHTRLLLKQQPFKLILSGGVLTNSQFIRASVIQKVQQTYPMAEIVREVTDATWGAIAIAKRVMSE